MSGTSRGFFAAFLRYAIAAPVGVVLLIAACSPVTVENYAKLEAGMSREQVYAILGKPDEVTGGGLGPLQFSAETWKGRRQVIQVSFGNDKLALKSITPTRAP